MATLKWQRSRILQAVVLSKTGGSRGRSRRHGWVQAVAHPRSKDKGSLLCVSVRADRYGDRDAEYVRTGDTVNQGAAIGVPENQ